MGVKGGRKKKEKNEKPWDEMKISTINRFNSEK